MGQDVWAIATSSAATVWATLCHAGRHAAGIGYVFQMFNLIPYLSVIDNVTLPLRFSPRRRKRMSNPHREAKRLLAHIGMSGLLIRIRPEDVANYLQSCRNNQKQE